MPTVAGLPKVVTPTNSFPAPIVPAASSVLRSNLIATALAAPVVPNNLLATASTDPVVPNNPFAAGYGHRSNFPCDVDVQNYDIPKYTYGRIRRYDESTGQYGSWESLIAYDPVRPGDSSLYMDRPCVTQLKRGGTIRYFPRIVSEERRNHLAQKCRDFQEYRQYKFGPGGLANEPRVHVLLSAYAAAPNGDASSSTAALGYQYHGIRMQAQPLDSEPAIAALSTELASAYGLPEWNIGCDAIVYRNGNDNIGWHSDDTQGESKVTCIVPESPGVSRSVHVRPKKSAKKPLRDGEEEIQLFVRQGDGCESIVLSMFL